MPFIKFRVQFTQLQNCFVLNSKTSGASICEIITHTSSNMSREWMNTKKSNLMFFLERSIYM